MKKKAKKSKVKTKAKPKLKAKVKLKLKKAARGQAKPKKAKKGKIRGTKKVKASKVATVIPPANSVELGRVEDYYAKIGVVALTLQNPVRVGDPLYILGHTTHLELTLDSMQINHQPVTEARTKDAVGIKVGSRVRRGDHVYLIKG